MKRCPYCGKENKSPFKASMRDGYYERLIRLVEIGSVANNTTKTMFDSGSLMKLRSLVKIFSSIWRIPVTELDFSQRTLNCLKEAELETLGDLVSRSEYELLGEYKNFGKKSLTEIKTTLSEIGLSLGMEVKDEKR